MTTAESPRLTLRDLPLPVKMVITVFLISVGLGYGSALMQMHFQHSTSGTLMPTLSDIIAKFSGVSWPPLPEAPKVEPKSKFQQLLEAPETEPFNGSGSMVKAFTKKALEGFEEADRPNRDGERRAMIAWIKAGAPREAYEKDSFPLPDDIMDITIDYVGEGRTVKIHTLIDDRCARCHQPDADQAKFPLHTYDSIAKYTKVSKRVTTDPAKAKQLPADRLTQSTHAHLLSFSMLYLLTGLVFAFSSYPMKLRLILAPMVLVAQVADISCWWLARLEGVGPYFAMAIMGTGGVVGLSVMLQITLSLFNLYDLKGKLVVLLLFIVGALGFGVLAKTVILPTLAAEKIEMDATNAIEAGVEKGQ